MTYILYFETYHDNGKMDNHAFATLEQAKEYVQSVEPPDIGSEISADIYQIKDGGVELVEQLFAVEKWWVQALSLTSCWVHSYEEYAAVERRYRATQTPPVLDSSQAFQSMGYTRFSDE